MVDPATPFKTKPYPHQIQALDKMGQNQRYGLLLEMGLGKTKIVIDFHCLLLERARLDPTTGAVKPFLIVCPKSLIYNWQKEYVSHGWKPIVVVPLLGTAKRKQDMLREAMGALTPIALVVNYEGLGNIMDILTKQRFSCIVMDESTKVKNHRSQRSKMCRLLSARADRAYILTGNPTPNSPLDLYSQFSILDQGLLGFKNFFSFKCRYAVLGGYKGKEITSFQNLPELQERLASSSLQVTKAQVLKDLPPKTYQAVEVDLMGEQRQAYEQMRTEALMDIREHKLAAPAMLAKLTRLSQITGGFVRDVNGIMVNFTPNAKIEALEDIVEGIAPGRKFIIWARFIPEIFAIHALLEKMGVRSEKFYGEVSEDQRRDIIKTFQDKTSALRCIVGQVETGGYGHTLTEAELVIYFSNSYSYGDRIQSEDRAHRIGLTHPVLYIDLVARSTIDRAIQAALKMKKDLSHMLQGQTLEDLI